MPFDNPYAWSDESASNPGHSGQDTHAALQSVLQTLSRTRPWVRFLGIIAVIGGILMAGGGICLVAWGGGGMGRITGGGGIGVAVVLLIYLAISAAYFVGARFLLGYASGIDRAVATGQLSDIAAALAYQTRFWQFSGFCTAAIMILYVLSFAAAFAF